MTEQEIYEAAKNYAINELGMDDDSEIQAIVNVWFSAIEWYHNNII